MHKGIIQAINDGQNVEICRIHEEDGSTNVRCRVVGDTMIVLDGVDLETATNKTGDAYLQWFADLS